VTSNKLEGGAVTTRAIAIRAVGGDEVKDLITATSAGTAIGAGEAGDAQVTCPNRGMVVGGGFAWQEDEPNSIIYSTPSETDPNHTWTVRGMVPAGSNMLYAWASCLSP
jgi:hypothetical protein